MESGYHLLMLCVFYAIWLPGFCTKDPDSGFMHTSQKLLDDVAKKTSPHVHPSLYKGSPVQVRLNFTIIRVEDLDQTHDLFTIGLIVGQLWTDPRLSWNSSDYGDIEIIRMPTSAIWTPDLTLYNGEGNMDHSHSEKVVVLKDGTVMWYPTVTYHAYCAMDFGSYPFDTQHCTLVLGSWIYSNTEIAFYFSDEKGGKTMERTVHFETMLGVPTEHPQWEIVGNQADGKISNLTYNEYAQFHVIEVSLDMKRKPDYYRYVTIGPSVLLTMMVPIMFLLPPRPLEKMVYGVGVLISHLLVILMLQDEIPYNHGSTPRLAKYHLITMCLTSLGICVSVFVVWLTEKGRYHRSVPGWVHRGILGRRGLRWFLCVDSLRPVDKFYSSLTSRSMEDDYADVDQDAADGGRELDSVNSSRNKQLSEIQKSFRTVVGKISADEALNNVQREWEELAMVVDRICFISFYVIYILISMSMT